MTAALAFACGGLAVSAGWMFGAITVTRRVDTQILDAAGTATNEETW